MEMPANKDKLLARPNTSVVTELVETAELKMRSGEVRVGVTVTDLEEEDRMALASELEQIEVMQAQLTQMQQQTAAFQAVLHDKISRVRVDLNPNRRDRSIVSRPETPDNLCPRNLAEPLDKVYLDPGTAYSQTLQDIQTENLWPGLVTQGLGLPEHSFDPPTSSRHPIYPSSYEAPRAEEVTTAQALLELAGSSQGGTRQSGTSKRDLGPGDTGSSRFVGVTTLDGEVEKITTDLEQDRRYGKSDEEVSKHLGPNKVRQGETKRGLEVKLTPELDPNDNLEMFSGPSEIMFTRTIEAQSRQMTMTPTLNVSSSGELHKLLSVPVCSVMVSGGSTYPYATGRGPMLPEGSEYLNELPPSRRLDGKRWVPLPTDNWTGGSTQRGFYGSYAPVMSTAETLPKVPGTGEFRGITRPSREIRETQIVSGEHPGFRETPVMSPVEFRPIGFAENRRNDGFSSLSRGEVYPEITNPWVLEEQNPVGPRFIPSSYKSQSRGEGTIGNEVPRVSMQPATTTPVWSSARYALSGTNQTRPLEVKNHDTQRLLIANQMPVENRTNSDKGTPMINQTEIAKDEMKNQKELRVNTPELQSQPPETWRTLLNPLEELCRHLTDLCSLNENAAKQSSTTIPELGHEGSNDVPSSTTKVVVEEKPEPTGDLVKKQGDKARQWLKLEKFDGQTPLEAFLAKFEICAKHNGWNDSERLSQLMCAMVGGAAQVLWEFNASGLSSWSDLVKRLRARYGSSDQSMLYRTQLRTRRQKEGESLQALSQDIRRLMVLAYAGPSTEMSEMVAIDAFLDALIDTDLALRVRDREPTTLELACRYAIRLEANQSTRGRVENGDRRTGRIKAVREDDKSRDRLTQQLIEQISNLERRQSQMEQRWKSPTWSAPMSDEPSHPGVTYTPAGEVQLTERAYRRNSPTNNWKSRRSDKRCYRCHQLGHLQRNCPRMPPPNRENTRANEDEVDETANARVIKGSTNAYLPLRVNGRNVLALVDTGSEMSLIPASAIRKQDMKESQQLLKAANGTSIRVLGEIAVDCELSGQRFSAQCLVTEQLSEMILGLSWLEQQNAIWNFRERWIRLQGQSFPLYSMAGTAKCRKVAVARDVQVPPMCELDVEVYAVLPHLKADDRLWATQSQVLNSGVILASTLLPNRANDLFTRVMNPTQNMVRIKRGSQWGLEEVQLDDVPDEPDRLDRPAAVYRTTEVVETSDPETVLSPLWQTVDEEIPSEVQEKLRSIVLEHRQAFSSMKLR